MNTTINTMRKNLLIAVSALALGAATFGAQAQDTTTPAPGAKAVAPHEGHRGPGRGHGEHRGGNPAERMAKYQARLHDKLKLTAAQEPAWAAFTAANAPKKPAGDWKAKREAFAKLSAPQRMEQWIAMSKERIAGQEARLGSLKTFYAVLTPEQQKVFDDSVPGGMHGGPRGHRDAPKA